MTRKIVGAVALVVALLSFQSAQAFPDRPVKLVVTRLRAVLRTSWRGCCRTRWAPRLGSRSSSRTGPAAPAARSAPNRSSRRNLTAIRC